MRRPIVIKRITQDILRPRSGDSFEVIEAVGGRWMILRNGFQWGTDPHQFDHGLGCSKQTWSTKAEAKKVVKGVRRG